MSLRYLVVVSCLALMAAGTYFLLQAIEDDLIPWPIPVAVVVAVVVATGYMVVRGRRRAAKPPGP